MMKRQYGLVFVVFLLSLSSCQNKKQTSSPIIAMSHSTAPSSHAFYYQKRFYEPKYPFEMHTYSNHIVDFQKFLAQHHYSSRFKPLIGVVTYDKHDIDIANQLLVKIKETVTHHEQLQLITGEVLSKVIAYRNLELGQKIPVPYISKKGKVKLAMYKVDRVFNLLGVPAFGLLPSKKKVAPIIIFRGTDLSLSMKGYSSILADLDLNGPGVLAFYTGHDELRYWLQEVGKKYPKARALGYSLGGALTQYLCVLENDLLSQDPRFPSIAFNEPGVSLDFVEKWNRLPASKRPLLQGYIVEGDIVSSVGKLIGDVKALTLDHPLEPLKAHVTLMSLQQRVYAYSLDVSLKNELDYSSIDESIKNPAKSAPKQLR